MDSGRPPGYAGSRLAIRIYCLNCISALCTMRRDAAQRDVCVMCKRVGASSPQKRWRDQETELHSAQLADGPTNCLASSTVLMFLLNLNKLQNRGKELHTLLSLPLTPSRYLSRSLPLPLLLFYSSCKTLDRKNCKWLQLGSPFKLLQLLLLHQRHLSSALNFNLNSELHKIDNC